MHCKACEKTIRRALEKEGVAITQISYKKGTATITGDIDDERLAAALERKGYGLDEESAAGVGEAFWAIGSNGLLLTGILIVLQTVLLHGLYARLPSYAAALFLPVLATPVIVALNLTALWHQRSYGEKASCMHGMMAGMTIGMMTGFLVGATAGIVNGMFWGAVFGTIIGSLAGVYSGKCCGTMGVMEGLMAGLMGGTMGAMLTVMMVNDHWQAFLIFLIVVCALILAGMMRMIEEANDDAEYAPWPFTNVLAAGVMLMLAITAFLLFMPRWL